MKYFLILAFLFVLTSCEEKYMAPESPAQVGAYTLGAGDELRITVFNEEELSGEFEVDGTGVVAIPLIGELQAAGKDVRQLENDLEKKLKNGYLREPRVSIEVLNFRPFFILGEVNNPGSYPYVNRLTAANAVALAGGYTYRAKTSKISLERDGKELMVREQDYVLPGDTLRIKERFF